MATDICEMYSCFLCAHCLPEWKGAIASNRQILHYKKGQPLFSEGEEVSGIYFIASGAVKVHQSWGPDRELILHFAKAGDVVGYRGQGGERIFPISATALDNTVACFISTSFLEATLKTNTSFLYAMMQLYAGELRKAEKRMRDLALMDVRGRIAEALFAIRDAFALDDQGYISLPVTRLDMASFAGTTYETVFRLFSDWSHLGLIETSGKRIRIKDSIRLQEFIRHGG
ncbi:MAG: Crp/Fnr family transcriptional regulator [Bacteroidota bacterium]|nr:Crp/Fnr family transcriptional regulator [Bacteroidota bacterium]MDP4216626.1 Crp/Fnr family transcriptional regulator [Bacteroidota bacterium]MDP4246952.1 Crp/Fnr family transcriptional regulator [Bacteroidota bacterium]MDP4255298.1 Crp/Fnr family transcriptional regulator [Bacteroidota bacterium]MDP4260538.1 Crp/Fnr family transcriptional regulator [Bacteroidota bacterium]